MMTPPPSSWWSNIQRENILPSERAQAYKMKLEAIRRKAGRPAKEAENLSEENSVQVGQNFDGKRHHARF